MPGTKTFFLLLVSLFFFAQRATASDFLASERFFTFRQGVLVTEKEIPLPAEPLLLPRVLELPQEPYLLSRKIEEEGITIKDFYTFPKKGTPVLKVKAALLFDRDYLYVRFRADKSPDYQLRARKFEVECAQIWHDDNFEIFLDPFLTRTRYYQFIINSRAQIFDGRFLEKLVPDPRAVCPTVKIAEISRDLSWESQAKVLWTQVEEKYWTVLVRIPFTAFGIKTLPLGSTWGANFTHTSWEKKELIQWQVTPGPGGFHQPRKFGAITFGEEKDKEIEFSFDVPIIGYGENILSLKTENRGKNKKCLLTITLFDEEKNIIERQERYFLIPEGKKELKTSFFLPDEKEGNFFLSAEVTFAQKQKSYYVKFFSLAEIFYLHLPLTHVHTTDKEIKGSLRLNLGEGSLKQVRLRFEMTGPEKNYFTEIDNLEGNYLKFGIDPAILSLGENRLQVTVSERERKIGAQSIELFMIKPPFDF